MTISNLITYENIKKILKNNIYYLIFSYILIILGFYISIFYKPINLKMILYFLILPLSLSDLILSYFDKIKPISYKTYKNIIIMSLVINTILIGFYYNISNCSIINFNTYFTTVFSSLIFALIVNETLRKIFLIEEQFKKQNILLIPIIITYIIFLEGNLFISKILKDILSNLSNYFSISIAIIMLCATLSLLAFTYCMILEKDDGKRQEMKENGEKYFISTIFSMISLVLVFITTIIEPNIKIIDLLNLNISNILNFILVNFYMVIILFISILTLYSIYFLIISSKSSLEILNFEI